MTTLSAIAQRPVSSGGCQPERLTIGFISSSPGVASDCNTDMQVQQPNQCHNARQKSASICCSCITAAYSARTRLSITTNRAAHFMQWWWPSWRCQAKSIQKSMLRLACVGEELALRMQTRLYANTLDLVAAVNRKR